MYAAKPSTKISIYLLALVLLIPFSASAKRNGLTPLGQISGTVVDQAGASVDGGAVARGLVRNGILLPTGETLAQVQLRLLGPGLQPNVLFTKNPGFALLNLRGGFRIGERSSVTLILENILDKNYRTMGSGSDGPGTNTAVRYSFNF